MKKLQAQGRLHISPLLARHEDHAAITRYQAYLKQSHLDCPVIQKVAGSPGGSNPLPLLFLSGTLLLWSGPPTPAAALRHHLCHSPLPQGLQLRIIVLSGEEMKR